MNDSVDAPCAHGDVGTLQPLWLGSMFWLPAYVRDSARTEHLPFAFWLIEALRPRVLVEAGVDGGISYFAFCQAVDRLRLQTRCYAVDVRLSEASGGAAAAGGSDFEAVHSHNESQYTAFSRLLRSSFGDAPAHFGEGSIDLLHLNGSVHDIASFDAWLPKLSKCAVVLLHGVQSRDAREIETQFFSALAQRYPHFEFAHGSGLSVLGVGTERTGLIHQFFEAHGSERLRRAVQEVFARLGRACANGHMASKEEDGFRQMTEQFEVPLSRPRVPPNELPRLRREELEQLRMDSTAETQRLDAALRHARNDLSGVKASALDAAAELQRTSSRLTALEQETSDQKKLISNQSAELKRLSDALSESSKAAMTEGLRHAECRTPWHWKLVSRMQAMKRLLVRRGRQERAHSTDAALTHQSELIDARCFAKRYPDVESGLEPAEHCTRLGGSQQSDSGPQFSTAQYLRDYADVAEAGIDPLLHYIQFGRSRERTSQERTFRAAE